MAIQLSETVRNARLDQIETTIGTAPHFYIRSGTPPANCAAADSGNLIIDITLPSDWMQAAASGQKVKSAAAWSGTASGSYTAGHWRIKDNGATTCHMQGTAGTGSEDLVLDNAVISSGQTVTINTFTLTDANS
jgi:hypothetical protein